MELNKLQTLVINALEDVKAHELTAIDVRGKIDITDLMIIASGTSDRHIETMLG